MGFARRLARKSARRAVRKTERVMTLRPVRKADHPMRTARYAATPQPVRQVGRSVYTVRHPVRAAEHAAAGAVPAPPRGVVPPASLTPVLPFRPAESGERPAYARHAGGWEEDARRQAGYGGR